MAVANRNDRQRDNKLAKKADEPESELYTRPSEGCEELQIVVDMPDQHYRITQRLMSRHHQLVEFAIVLSEWDGEGWPEIYSIDTCHGYLHEHVTGHRKADDRRDIRPMVSQLDVQESLDPAYDQVRDHYLKLTG